MTAQLPELVAPPAPAACEDCDFARHTLHHGFTHGCSGCAARAASRSWAHWEAKGVGRQTSLYLQLLDTLGVTHEQVKAARAADALAKGAA